MTAAPMNQVVERRNGMPKGLPSDTPDPEDPGSGRPAALVELTCRAYGGDVGGWSYAAAMSTPEVAAGSPLGATVGSVDEQPERLQVSLSPSRAGDFMTWPLLYRFRVIDCLPEPPS